MIACKGGFNTVKNPVGDTLAFSIMNINLFTICTSGQLSLTFDICTYTPNQWEYRGILSCNDVAVWYILHGLNSPIKDRVVLWARHSTFIVSKEISAFPVWCVANTTIESLLL